jgi:hypothetical protein
MLAGLPYAALRDAVLTHPTLVEGLIPLFASVPSAISAASNVESSQERQSKGAITTAPGRVA